MRSNLFIYCFIFISFSLKSTNCERKYRHSKEELELTKIVKISQNRCKKNEIPVFIHSAAKSSGKYYDRRQTTRNTWAKEAVNNSLKVIFVIGLPEDEETQEELENESDEYNDMLQFGFNDNYYNLTLKAISILRWITRNCKNSDYVLKTDDDVLVNVKRLKKMFDNKEFRNGLTGRVLNTYSNRVSGHKWFMPKKLYPRNRYQLLWGFSYVMSKKTIKKLYKTISNYSGPVLDIDDLFITGVIAEKAKIRKYDSSLFGGYCGTNACYMHNMLVFHGCEFVNQTFYIWNSWKQTSEQECDRIYRIFGINFDSYRYKK